MANIIEKENSSLLSSQKLQQQKDDFPKSMINKDEMNYLKLIEELLSDGQRRDDRTGTGTIGLFGKTARYSLRDGTMPLLTTKRVFWKGIVEELLWFISGSTDAKVLSSKGVKIWEPNGSREFLDKCGFPDRREGDLGPVYGFQWRHYGAKYCGPDADYTGEGIDQLAQVIEQIKNDPNSRRIIMSAWNPIDLKEMVLPPCHTLVQFYVSNGELSSQLYQRSGDVGLGVPFNIASYALLTHMIAHVTGLKAGEFVHTIGDAHIYSNHVDALKEQLKREPRPFPKISFAPGINTIDDFTFDSIKLENYNPYPTIKMDMAV
jgi:thymidylate synthase